MEADPYELADTALGQQYIYDQCMARLASEHSFVPSSVVGRFAKKLCRKEAGIPD